MFVAYIKKHNIPYEIYDGRAPGAVVADVSDPLRLIFDPPLTPIKDWVGAHVIFYGDVDPAIAKLGSVIASQELTVDETAIRWVDFADPLPFAPSAGETFQMIRRSGNLSITTSEYVTLRHQIENVKWGTDIDLGFDSCTIEINERTTNVSRLYSQMVGNPIEIQDMYGRRCFSGIVISASMNGLRGTVTGLGIMHTFGWFDFFGIYDETASNTSTQIIRDVCSVNPFIHSDYSFTVDRKNIWHDAQEAIGGIGPRDYSDISTRAIDVLDDVLSLGHYGISEDKVSLQILHDSKPFLKVTKRAPDVTEPDFIISNQNIAYGFTNVEISADVNDVYTNIYGSYTDESGDSFRTGGAYNLRFLRKFGFRSKLLAASSGYAEAMALVQATRSDKSMLAAPGNITISGKIRRRGSTSFIPVYMLKAGDTLSIEGNIGQSSLYQNSISTPGIFVVGHTEYSSDSDSVSISIAELPLKSELFANRLKV